MLKNLKNGTKIGLGFAIAILFLVIVSAIGITRLGELNTAVDTLVNDRFPKTVQANAIIDNINIVARSTRNMLLDPSEANVKRETERITGANGASAIISQNMDILEKTLTLPRGKELFAAMSKARSEYRVHQGNFLELASDTARGLGDRFVATVAMLHIIRLTFMSNKYMFGYKTNGALSGLILGAIVSQQFGI